MPASQNRPCRFATKSATNDPATIASWFGATVFEGPFTSPGERAFPVWENTLAESHTANWAIQELFEPLSPLPQLTMLDDAPPARAAAAPLSHREPMIERRRRQLARVPGFTPVRNIRLQRWLARHLRSLLADVDGKKDHELLDLAQPADLAAARGRALRFLPAPRMVRSLAVRPSKSDDPVYRKQGVA